MAARRQDKQFEKKVETGRSVVSYELLWLPFEESQKMVNPKFRMHIHYIQYLFARKNYKYFQGKFATWATRGWGKEWSSLVLTLT